MPKIENINGSEIVNIDHLVGKNGVNNFMDVTIVQALLELNSHFNNSPIKKPVRVDGIYKSDVEKNILAYQEFIRRLGNQGQLPFWVAKDGRVAPAKKGVKLLTRQEWTIVSLNGSGGLIAAVLGFDSTLDYITTKFNAVTIFLRPLFL